uniref:Uncharacterized protein n=1 Tax=Maylandia zebra TaxID=106582 RepID=A0A3P9BAP6_9CICH
IRPESDLSKGIRDNTVDLHEVIMNYKTISKNFGEKVKTVGSGAPCKIFSWNYTGGVPLVIEENAQAHLKFASKHLNNSEKAWGNVLRSDEAKIEHFGINLNCRLWRKRNGAYDSKNTIHTVEHRSGNIVLKNLLLSDPKPSTKATKDWLKKVVMRELEGANLVINYRKRLTVVLATKGFSSILEYSIGFSLGIKYFFPSTTCKLIHNFDTMCFL